jgi:serine/threonine protein kinase
MGWCTSDDSYEIATEFMPSGSILDVMNAIRRGNPPAPFWNETGIAKILAGIVLGMRGVHGKGWVHHDLNSRHVLSHDLDLPKNSGFCYCRMVDLAVTAGVGTPLYAEPELDSRDDYGNSIDIFSFGFIAWELITEQSLITTVFKRMNPFALARAIAGGKRPPIPRRMDSRVASCLQKYWSGISSERPMFLKLAEILKGIGYKVRPGVDTKEVAKYVAQVEADEQLVIMGSS